MTMHVRYTIQVSKRRDGASAWDLYLQHVEPTREEDGAAGWPGGGESVADTKTRRYINRHVMSLLFFTILKSLDNFFLNQ